MAFRKPWVSPLFPVSRREFFVTAVILLCAVLLCFFLRLAGSIDGFAAPVFVLAVLLISRLTSGYLYGFLSVILGVVFVNFIFTYPNWAFAFHNPGYTQTFYTLLMISSSPSPAWGTIRPPSPRSRSPPRRCWARRPESSAGAFPR